jgi:hypothetical protein
MSDELVKFLSHSPPIRWAVTCSVRACAWAQNPVQDEHPRSQQNHAQTLHHACCSFVGPECPSHRVAPAGNTCGNERGEASSAADMLVRTGSVSPVVANRPAGFVSETAMHSGDPYRSRIVLAKVSRLDHASGLPLTLDRVKSSGSSVSLTWSRYRSSSV